MPDQSKNYVIRSPLRPLTRQARRDLEEFDIIGAVDSPDGGMRNGGVLTAERPPRELLKEHELEVDEEPDEVWEGDGGERIEIYEEAGYATVDGREQSMSVEEIRTQLNEQSRFTRISPEESP